jgi:tryptophan halogenase
MKAKNPELADVDLHLIPFPSGRREKFWVGNVAGVGNSSAFVEPLEATALHLVISQVWNLIGAIRDSGGCPSEALKAIENQRFTETWDDVRDFLAMHYRFNRKLDTPFWRHCNENTPLGGATDLVAAYAETGPALGLGVLIPSASIFGYVGYINLLVGQRAPTKVRSELNKEESRHWQAHCQRIRDEVKQALPSKVALKRMYEESKFWPRDGI